jgi:la-related protein 1
MTAATSKSEMPVFSYAQAARGIPAASTAPQPTKPTPADQTKLASHDANDTLMTGVSVNASPVQIDSRNDAEKSGSGADEPKSFSAMAQQSAVTDSFKLQVPGTSSPSNGVALTPSLPRDDDISVKTNGVSDSTWDRQSQTSDPAEKSNSVEEGSKEKSSNPSEKSSPLKELKAAPIPAVNVWQQRKEAQEAKAKASAATLKSAVSLPKITSGKSSNVTLQSSADNHDPPKASGKKKTADNPSDGAGFQGKDRKRLDGGKTRDESELLWLVRRECLN